jgi:hypothetical protein
MTNSVVETCDWAIFTFLSEEGQNDTSSLPRAVFFGQSLPESAATNHLGSMKSRTSNKAAAAKTCRRRTPQT